MDSTHFKDLLPRYIAGTLTREEMAVFARLVNDKENEALLKEAIGRAFEDPSFQDLAENERAGPIYNRIMERAAETERRRTPTLWMPAAAAVLLLVVGAGTFFLLRSNRASKSIAMSHGKATPPAYDIKPGGDKALLTLGDGSTISLDGSGRGVLAQQGSANVVKLSKGQLAYNQIKNVPSRVVYNTVSTQRGGQYQVSLPDGSKVWLNAASSLRFPTSFTGKSRLVIVTGEAYFDIAPHKEMPFIVQAGDLTLQVLGTQFDVMAYDNERNINTTLLQGAVRVRRAAANELLRPGQQARFDKASTIMKVADADTEEATAWKNGVFQFSGADIETVMRQLERWYDVEVKYSGKIPGGHFSGIISRQTMLSQVLSILEVNDVHFRIEGRKIIVL